jgi:hypothetical protein
MDEIYGLFHDSVVSLSEADKKLKESWIDEVGKTYYEMNENIYVYCKRINALHLSSIKTYEMVKNNYDEDEINDDVNKLIYMANEVL